MCRHWFKGRCKLHRCTFRHDNGASSHEEKLHSFLAALEEA